jgi:hypothetical protein
MALKEKRKQGRGKNRINTDPDSGNKNTFFYRKRN